jgi:NAD(P)-dependent dehydrogenase (short-subunit alcohol dehydrogenase family)
VDEQTYGRRFEGKVGVVTGASTNPGIGRSTARRLGLEGASVIINARSEDRLRDTEQQLRDEGIAVVAVPGAADDDETPVRLVDAALEHFGRIDLLVNTVGGATYQGSALAIDRASLLDTLALNT